MNGMASLGLFLLRAAAGAMMIYAHGWDKLMNFSEKSGGFPDPLGLGSTTSLSLAVFAEVFCAAGLIIGLATRFCSAGLAVTMGVAAFIVHADDAFTGSKELACVYLAIFVALIFTGAGGMSVDAALMAKRRAGGGDSGGDD